MSVALAAVDWDGPRVPRSMPSPCQIPYFWIFTIARVYIGWPILALFHYRPISSSPLHSPPTPSHRRPRCQTQRTRSFRRRPTSSRAPIRRHIASRTRQGTTLLYSRARMSSGLRSSRPSLPRSVFIPILLIVTPDADLVVI